MGVDYSAVAGLGFWLEEGVLFDDNVVKLMEAQFEDGRDFDDYCRFELFQGIFLETKFEAKEIGSRAYSGNKETKDYDIMVVLSEPFDEGFRQVPIKLQELRRFLDEKKIQYQETEDEKCLILGVLVD